MARLLLSAARHRPWSPGYALAPALEKTGHTVQVFDYRSAEDPARELLAAVRTFKPDLHVVYGGEPYSPDLIRQVRNNTGYNVLWYPLVTPVLGTDVVQLGNAYDMFFTIAQGLVDRFAAAGLHNVEWLPEGMEPSIYQYDTISDRDRETFACDVTLVGRLESDNPAYLERWKLVKRIVDENFHIKWWGPRIRRKTGTFVLGLLLSKVSRSYGGRFVWNETYAKAVHLSKIFIAREAYPNVRLSLSARAFTAMGLGAFYLTFPNRGVEQMFEPDRELVLFRTPDEMVEKIRYYLARDDERTAIAAAAKKKVLAEHTYQRRFEQMFAVIAERGFDIGAP